MADPYTGGGGDETEPTKYQYPSAHGTQVLLRDDAGGLAPWRIHAISRPGGSWGVYLISADGTKSQSFQPGSYITETGHAIEVDASANISQTRVLSEEERRSIFGGGTAERNYAAEQAAADAEQARREEAQRKWQEEQNRLNREFEAEQNRMAREAEAEQARIAAEERRRQGLLSTAGQLLEGRRQSRDVALSRASELAGQDIFRFLANVKQQAVPQGTMTPIDVFKAQNAQIATAQAPVISPSSTIGDLESAIAKMTGMQEQEEKVGVPGPFVGFAGGGALGMGPGMMRQGTNKSAVLVGDKTINGDEEVLVYDHGTGSAEVIPLGRAQTGAEFQPSEASLTVLPQLFQTLRQDVGGVQDQWMGAVGKKLGVPSLSAMGYLTGNQQATGGARLGERGALATPLSIKQGLIESTRYTPQQAAQLSNLIGVLPAPHKAAKFLRDLEPSEAKAVISAYKLAGFPTADLEAVLNESTISGPARTGVSLR